MLGHHAAGGHGMYRGQEPTLTGDLPERLQQAISSPLKTSARRRLRDLRRQAPVASRTTTASLRPSTAGAMKDGAFYAIRDGLVMAIRHGAMYSRPRQSAGFHLHGASAACWPCGDAYASASSSAPSSTTHPKCASPKRGNCLTISTIPFVSQVRASCPHARNIKAFASDPDQPATYRRLETFDPELTQRHQGRPYSSGGHWSTTNRSRMSRRRRKPRPSR